MCKRWLIPTEWDGRGREGNGMEWNGNWKENGEENKGNKLWKKAIQQCLLLLRSMSNRPLSSSTAFFGCRIFLSFFASVLSFPLSLSLSLSLSASGFFFSFHFLSGFLSRLSVSLSLSSCLPVCLSVILQLETVRTNCSKAIGSKWIEINCNRGHTLGNWLLQSTFRSASDLIAIKPYVHFTLTRCNKL